MSGGASINAGFSGLGISSQMSQLSSVILGKNTVYAPKGMQALSPTHRNESNFLAPANGVINPAFTTGLKIVYSLPKTSTLIGKIWSEIQLAAAQTNPTFTPAVPADTISNPQVAAVAAVGVVQAEYVKNIGDLIFEQILMRYGSTVLQQYNSEFQVFQRQLTRNNINIEYINVEVLGNLPPGGNTEQTLVDALYQGVILRHPVEHMWYVQHADESWMPEALALEGQLEFTLRALANLIVTRTGTNAVFVGGASVLPAITDLRLRYQEITLSAAEKENRLRFYKSPEGLVNLFQDIEEQPGFRIAGTGAGGNLNFFVPLSNFRLDMAEVMFVVRMAQNTGAVTLPGYVFQADLRDWRGSRAEANTQTASLLGGAGGHLGVNYPILTYKMTAGGKDLQNDVPELYGRTHIRKQYHPDAQTGGGVHMIAFAIYPEDTKNATGHASASVLGTLALNIVCVNPGAAIILQVDVWSKSYNLMQARRGGINKALA